MEKYESKQKQINHPAALIFPIISRLDLMTPAIQDKVEEWEATPDSCSFKIKGMKVGLRIAERVENKQVKIVADEGGIPIDFSFWIQLIQLSSVAQSCPTLCDPMSRSMPGLPVYYQLPEFTQTHIHTGPQEKP